MGKPTYTPEIAQKVLELLSKKGSLRAVCRELGIGRDTIIGWVVKDIDGFAGAYARAKEAGIDEFVEETLEISDTPLLGEETVQKADGGIEVRTSDMLGHRKLQIETRRWLAERMAPQKYGAKQVVEHQGAVEIKDLNMTEDERAALLSLIKKGI